MPLRSRYFVNPYIQSGLFLGSRFVLGLQYQYSNWGAGVFERNSYGAFARYYFMNNENVGLYGYGHLLRSHTRSTLEYMSGNSLEMNFGIGSDIRLSENWRLNMEVNLFQEGNFGSAAKLGVSYAIPYRKKAAKTPL